MQEIFNKYAKKHIFLNELSGQELAVLKCMFIENYQQGYKDGENKNNHP